MDVNDDCTRRSISRGYSHGGQGGVLTEDHIRDGGFPLNPTQLEHKVPLTCDMLSANSIILESHDLEGPYGAKEADMSIAISASQAYTNAVSNAIAVCLSDFRVSPDKILEALERKRKVE